MLNLILTDACSIPQIFLLAAAAEVDPQEFLVDEEELRHMQKHNQLTQVRIRVEMDEDGRWPNIIRNFSRYRKDLTV